LNLRQKYAPPRILVKARFEILQEIRCDKSGTADPFRRAEPAGLKREYKASKDADDL
jgi:hypothetical protein